MLRTGARIRMSGAWWLGCCARFKGFGGACFERLWDFVTSCNWNSNALLPSTLSLDPELLQNNYPTATRSPRGLLRSIPIPFWVQVSAIRSDPGLLGMPNAIVPTAFGPKVRQSLGSFRPQGLADTVGRNVQ